MSNWTGGKHICSRFISPEAAFWTSVGRPAVALGWTSFRNLTRDCEAWTKTRLHHHLVMKTSSSPEKPLSYLSGAAWFGHFPGFFHSFDLIQSLRVLHQVDALASALLNHHAQRPVWLCQVHLLLQTQSGQVKVTQPQWTLHSKNTFTQWDNTRLERNPQITERNRCCCLLTVTGFGSGLGRVLAFPFLALAFDEDALPSFFTASTGDGHWYSVTKMKKKKWKVTFFPHHVIWTCRVATNALDVAVSPNTR